MSNLVSQIVRTGIRDENDPSNPNKIATDILNIASKLSANGPPNDLVNTKRSQDNDEYVDALSGDVYVKKMDYGNHIIVFLHLFRQVIFQIR